VTSIGCNLGPIEQKTCTRPDRPCPRVLPAGRAQGTVSWPFSRSVRPRMYDQRPRSIADIKTVTLYLPAISSRTDDDWFHHPCSAMHATGSVDSMCRHDMHARGITGVDRFGKNKARTIEGVTVAWWYEHDIRCFANSSTLLHKGQFPPFVHPRPNPIVHSQPCKNKLYLGA
jgi:hypothetical protein